MQIRHQVGIIFVIALMALFGAVHHAHAQECTKTGYHRDNINLTAAVIASGDISDQTIDATGCNIGIYYGPGTSGAVDNVEVFGANYFGIVAAGDDGGTSSPAATSVNVTNSNIHNIGESPLNGAQHGVGIYYRACESGASATGTISGNSISHYQKNGITVSCSGADASITDNTVTGEGPAGYIAQNGIEVGFGATGSVNGNTVSANQYTGGSTFSTGILVVGGTSWCVDYGLCPSPNTTDVQVGHNVLTNNDGGVVFENFDGAGFEIPSSPTNDKAMDNTISDDYCTNGIYQAGIADVGNKDKIVHNDISGMGYDNGSCSVGTEIDDTYTLDAIEHVNAIQ